MIARITLVLAALAVLTVVPWGNRAVALFVWLVAPGVLAVVLIVASGWRVISNPSGIQAALAVLVFIPASLALLTLVAMARGAWPTYVPYPLLALAFVLAALLWNIRRRRDRSRVSRP